MNIEDYREYCLSLGTDVEEKLPFQKFKNGEGVLVFYVHGHMFSLFNCNDFSVISLKCQPERIEELKAQYECIGNPYNESPKHWVGINPMTAPDDLLKELTRNSYEIVKAKYKKKMTVKQITSDTADEKIKQLYETAFPEDEQIPWKDLMRLVEEMPLDFTAYYDGEDFIGFTIVYPRKSINWFWYFAVCGKLRGKGYGQKILTQMIEHYKGQSFVLDMESPTQVSENIDQRKRRQNFYIRNGFRDTNVYRTYNDITMTIMMRGEGTFTMKDWDDIIHELQQFWWPDDIEEE